MKDSQYIETLRKYFGYDSFRSIQLDIVRSIASGHDTLGLMPTGGGKSITFQVPALTMEGVCIVVTPLISLMKDQVEHLKERGIKAETINSSIMHKDMLKILDNAIYGAVKFLYVSPERLSQKLFLAKLYYMKVCFITVDEAHCISQWGYDFRPSYLNINKIREKLPDVPILALTATATPQVVEDIMSRLDFGKYSEATPQVFRMSFRRENLSYVVRRTDDKEYEMIHILNSVGGCGIIYTRNRERTKKLAKMLCENGIKAAYYHAGLDAAIKDKTQQRWMDDEVRVMVATNAFGMGIDKPDVRLVIHADCPDSLEEYFQEAGRAGRDGKRSYAVLLYNKSDRSTLMKRSTTAFPPKDYIKKVYDNLAYFFELAVESGEGARYEFNEEQFCMRFKHYPTHLEAALSILQNAGYIHFDVDPDNKPRAMILLSREALYHLENLSNAEEEVLMAMMRYYGSLFSELTYISIPNISMMSGIEEDGVYVALKSLAQRGVVRFVPRRNVPLIIFTQQRIPSERLRFEKDVYEVQRQRLEERINAVLTYIDASECRQRILMEYFGEKGAEPCGHCDYCLENKPQKGSVNVEDAVNRIMALFADNKQHTILEVKNLGLPKALLHDAIEIIREKEMLPPTALL